MRDDTIETLTSRGGNPHSDLPLSRQVPTQSGPGSPQIPAPNKTVAGWIVKICDWWQVSAPSNDPNAFPVPTDPVDLMQLGQYSAALKPLLPLPNPAFPPPGFRVAQWVLRAIKKWLDRSKPAPAPDPPPDDAPQPKEPQDLAALQAYAMALQAAGVTPA